MRHISYSVTGNSKFMSNNYVLFYLAFVGAYRVIKASLYSFAAFWGGSW